MLPLLPSISLGSSTFTALTFGVRCGTIFCQPNEYCSEHSHSCSSCEPLCDENQLNHFDKVLCIRDCQNYLHDRNYVRLSDYSAEIKQLKIYLAVTFSILVLLVILFFVVAGPKLWRILKKSKFFTSKKPKEKSIETAVTVANPHTTSPKLRIKNPQNQLNRTSSIFTVTGTEYDAKTVSTPISTRHPAEDTLTSITDYSYDNRALQLTPVNEEKPKIETTF